MKKSKPKRSAVPSIFICERCGTWFSLLLAMCKCPEGPLIEKWAAEHGWARKGKK